MRASGAVLLDRGSTSSVDIASLVDRSPHGNDGTFTDITISRLASGLQVMGFDGSSSVVTITGGDALKPTTAFTLAAWILVNTGAAAQHHTAISIGAAANRITLSARRNAAGNFVEVYNTGTSAWYASTTSLTLGTWNHVVAVIRPATTISFYFNGVLDNEPAHGAFPTFDGSVKLGWSGSGTEYLDGRVVLSRILNGALSAGQARQLYQSQKGWFE